MTDPIRAALVYYDPDGKVYQKNTDGTFTVVAVAVGSAAWGSLTGTLSDQTDLGTALAAKVPTSRTVNGHALSGNVTVTASDVSAVPTTRTVNGRALTGNITVVSSDVFGTSAAPATAASTGVTGTITWDASYIYVCIATNTWVRAAIATW